MIHQRFLPDRRSIGFRFVLLIVVIVTGFHFLAEVWRLRQIDTDLQRKHGEYLAALQARLETDLPVPLWTFDNPTIAKILESEFTPPIVAIAVHDQDGAEIAHQGPPFAAVAADDATIELRRLPISLEKDGEHYALGDVSFAASRSEVARAFDGEAWRGIAEVIVLDIIIVIALSLAFRLMVMLPLGGLAEALRRAADAYPVGERLELYADRPDEFGGVAAGFNRLIMRLRASLEQQSEQRFRAIIENSTDMLAICTPDGAVIYHSPAAGAQLGYGEQELQVVPIIACADAEDADLVRLRFAEIAGRPGAVAEGRCTVMHKDGRKRHLDWRVRNAGHVPGIAGYIVSARDITDLVETETQLRQMQKMEAIGQLTGGIAHDFNNYLTEILGNADLLLELGGQNAEQNQLLRHICEAGERAARLTQQMLAYSRKQPLRPVVTDINKLVSSLSELLRRTLGETISVRLVLAGGLWPSFVDTNQMESCILNLAINARDAMPGGGDLTIETRNEIVGTADPLADAELTPGAHVVVSVRDTGVGMSEEAVGRAFEPFYTTKPVGQGTGLGLSQVYGFVRQSGGAVRLYSELGRGTEVRIHLPRHVRPGDEAIPTMQDDVPRPPTGRETVLVVEDGQGVRNYSATVLQHLGYRVVLAETAGGALDRLRDDPKIDLMFTDIGLPDQDGRQLANAAVQLHPGLKVLFTTGYVRDWPSDERGSLLTKPFTVAVLAARVREVLDEA